MTSIFSRWVRAGLKPPAQRLEALWAGGCESDLSDFHVLRQDFSPTDMECQHLIIGMECRAKLSVEKGQKG